MKMITNFKNWKIIQEAEIASKSIHDSLALFFEEYGIEGSYEQAKDYIADKSKGYELTEDEFLKVKNNIKEGIHEKEKPVNDKWKEKFDNFFQTKSIKKKSSVFTNEISAIVTEFLQKNKDIEVESSEVTSYVKSLLGLKED